MGFDEEDRAIMKDILANITNMQTSWKTSCEEIKEIIGRSINILSNKIEVDLVVSKKAVEPEGSVGMKDSCEVELTVEASSQAVAIEGMIEESDRISEVCPDNSAFESQLVIESNVELECEQVKEICDVGKSSEKLGLAMDSWFGSTTLNDNGVIDSAVVNSVDQNRIKSQPDIYKGDIHTKNPCLVFPSRNPTFRWEPGPFLFRMSSSIGPEISIAATIKFLTNAATDVLILLNLRDIPDANVLHSILPAIWNLQSSFLMGFASAEYHFPSAGRSCLLLQDIRNAEISWLVGITPVPAYSIFNRFSQLRIINDVDRVLSVASVGRKNISSLIMQRWRLLLYDLYEWVQDPIGMKIASSRAYRSVTSCGEWYKLPIAEFFHRDNDTAEKLGRYFSSVWVFSSKESYKPELITDVSNTANSKVVIPSGHKELSVEFHNQVGTVQCCRLSSRGYIYEMGSSVSSPCLDYDVIVSLCIDPGVSPTTWGYWDMFVLKSLQKVPAHILTLNVGGSYDRENNLEALLRKDRVHDLNILCNISHRIFTSLATTEFFSQLLGISLNTC